MNWVDWAILIFLACSIWNGFREGAVRVGIGFVAVIAGFLMAAWFYGIGADWVSPWIRNRALASFLGFQLIFFGVVIGGALSAALIAHIFKFVGLSWIDRILGAGAGALRGAMVLIVCTLVLLAFAPNRMPNAVRDSQIAPYVLRASDVVKEVTPYEIKHSFDQAYAELRQMIRDVKRNTRLPISYD